MNIKQEYVDKRYFVDVPIDNYGLNADDSCQPQADASGDNARVKHELEEEEEVQIKTEIKAEQENSPDTIFDDCAYDSNADEGQPVSDDFYSEHSSSTRRLSYSSNGPIRIPRNATKVDEQGLKRDILNGEFVAIVKLNRIETYKKNYVCSECYEAFPSLAILNTHVFLHSESLFDTSDENEAAFRCEICDFECEQAKHTKYHKIIHTRDNHVQCDSCKNQCTKSRAPLKNNCNIRTFKCSTCHYKCSKYINFKYHLMIHTGEKPFECAQCDYKCITLAKLKLHEYVHGKLKPFKCDQCAYRCTQSSYLNKHKLTHSRKKSFGCNRCRHKCDTKDGLRVHKLIHLGEKPFKCDQCDFKCARSSYIKIHKETHLVKKVLK